MSERNAGLQTEQTEGKEAWQEQEENDNRLLNTDDLQTECFMTQGKPTLTHVGYCKIANTQNISVLTLDYHEINSEQENGILVVVSGKNQDGDIRWASHFEPRSNKNPQFDWAKAFSKAQRNLFRMFLYGLQIVDETLAKFQDSNGKKGQRQSNGEQPAKQATPKVNPLEQAKNATRTTASAQSTRAVLNDEFGVGLDELNDAAVLLWGNQGKWDVKTWQTYNNAILSLRKKQGELYAKMDDIHNQPVE